jgi:peptide/nickel transport system permease protein
MARYIFRRFLQAIPLIFLVSLVMFFVLQSVPGGPLSVYTRSRITAEALEQIKHNLGLDQPLHIQYIRWLSRAIQGDLGVSYDTQRPVLTEIVVRLPATLYLIGTVFVVVLLLSILIGVFSAIRQYTKSDILVTTITFVGQALPDFWIGLMLLLISNNYLINQSTGRPYLPAGGMYSIGEPFSVMDWFLHLILPALTLGLAWVSWYSRYVRASMLDVIHEDYIRTARAKGLKESVVIFKHALKNAAIPLTTMVALDLPVLVGGALFIETIFSWPGMARLFYRAVERRDYPILMGVIMVSSVAIILSGIIADIIYAYLDPRIHYE